MIEIQRITAETEPLFRQADERRLDSEEVAVRVVKGGFALEYRPKPNALWNIVSRDEVEEAALCAGERYLAFLDGEHAGRVALRVGEHRLALVDAAQKGRRPGDAGVCGGLGARARPARPVRRNERRERRGVPVPDGLRLYAWWNRYAALRLRFA